MNNIKQKLLIEKKDVSFHGERTQNLKVIEQVNKTTSKRINKTPKVKKKIV